MQDLRRARFTQDLLDEIRRHRDSLPSERPLILVVDDDAGTTMALEALLAVEGFEVETAANGTQALACVARRRPRVVLTDVRMPEMDGNELCRRLAEDPDTRSIPVFVITGHDPTSVDPNTHAAGVLHKPIEPARMISLLRTRTAAPAVSSD